MEQLSTNSNFALSLPKRWAKNMSKSGVCDGQGSHFWKFLDTKKLSKKDSRHANISVCAKRAKNEPAKLSAWCTSSFTAFKKWYVEGEYTRVNFGSESFKSDSASRWQNSVTYKIAGNARAVASTCLFTGKANLFVVVWNQRDYGRLDDIIDQVVAGLKM